jgi:hypothetical protein
LAESGHQRRFPRSRLTGIEHIGTPIVSQTEALPSDKRLTVGAGSAVKPGTV